MCHRAWSALWPFCMHKNSRVLWAVNRLSCRKRDCSSCTPNQPQITYSLPVFGINAPRSRTFRMTRGAERREGINSPENPQKAPDDSLCVLQCWGNFSYRERINVDSAWSKRRPWNKIRNVRSTVLRRFRSSTNPSKSATTHTQFLLLPIVALMLRTKCKPFEIKIIYNP